MSTDVNAAVARMRSEGDESLAAKATPGEWIRDYRGTIGHIKAIISEHSTPTVAKYRDSAPSILHQRDANGDFIAASRTDAPLLADLVHRLSVMCGCTPDTLEDRVRGMMAVAEELAATQSKIAALEAEVATLTREASYECPKCQTSRDAIGSQDGCVGCDNARLRVEVVRLRSPYAFDVPMGLNIDNAFSQTLERNADA